MIEIIKPREDKESTSYRIDYHRANNTGGGYSFDCDEQGKILPLQNTLAQRNLALCQAGKDYDGVKLVCRGVTKHVHQWTESAVGRCSCGREVELEVFTNTCECGADYNRSGQLLAPRGQWGCETGETLTDILMIP